MVISDLARGGKNRLAYNRSMLGFVIKLSYENLKSLLYIRAALKFRLLDLSI